MKALILLTFLISTTIFAQRGRVTAPGIAGPKLGSAKTLMQGVVCDPGETKIVFCNNTSHDWAPGSKIEWKAKKGNLSAASCDPSKPEITVTSSAVIEKSTYAIGGAGVPISGCIDIPVQCPTPRKCKGKVHLQ